MTVAIEELEALRPPLTRYCYRMLGSAADTDDAVQETLIRATTKADAYDPSRARLTTWVHSIATNVCLDMLRGARRRAVVMDLMPAATDGNIGSPLPPDHWIEPMPGRRLFGAQDPADHAVERETVRLAFVALLQRLSPRQRAVLVLRDVLSFSAQESADMLDTSVAAANSALQRARTTMRSVASEPSGRTPPTDAAQRELLRRYVDAFESHNVAALTAILREDAIASMPPFAWRLESGSRIAQLMGASDACAYDRLVPTDINGRPGLGQYRPSDDGVLRPFALVSIAIRDGRIAHITTFLGSGDRFAEFGLPATKGTADIDLTRPMS